MTIESPRPEQPAELIEGAEREHPPLQAAPPRAAGDPARAGPTFATTPTSLQARSRPGLPAGRLVADPRPADHGPHCLGDRHPTGLAGTDPSDRAPGDRADRERGRRSQRRAVPAQLLARRDAESLDVATGRTDAEGERLPPVVEGRETHLVTVSAGGLDVRQAGPAAQSSARSTLARSPASPDSSRASRVELLRPRARRVESGPALAGVIPHARCDAATWAGSPGPSPPARATGSAMNCTTSWASAEVETVVRQTAGARPRAERTSILGQPRAKAPRRTTRTGRPPTSAAAPRRCRPAGCRQAAGSAADVQRPLARPRARSEIRRTRTASGPEIPAHEPVIGARR